MHEITHILSNINIPTTLKILVTKRNRQHLYETACLVELILHLATFANLNNMGKRILFHNNLQRIMSKRKTNVPRKMLGNIKKLITNHRASKRTHLHS